MVHMDKLPIIAKRALTKVSPNYEARAYAYYRVADLMAELGQEGEWVHADLFDILEYDIDDPDWPAKWHADDDEDDEDG